ncbi:hypothetical protein CMV16_19360 [Peribacillus simplex]|nr:hypothetical protein CMV16_19360 [Peribacillus simplex]
MSKLEGIIKDNLICLLKEQSETLEFVEKLAETGELLFFGGAVRDVYIKNEQKIFPRDFDIAIKFKNERKFYQLIEEYEFKKNRFGGYKFKISGIDFDIWDLNNTWAFKNTDLVASEENLARSVFLNIDGIVYNFNTGCLHAELLKETLKRSELDISLEENPHVELNLLRALVFKRKYNLDLSNKLKTVFKFYKERSNKDNLINNLFEVQLSHYKAEKLSRDELEKELHYI